MTNGRPRDSNKKFRSLFLTHLSNRWKDNEQVHRRERKALLGDLLWASMTVNYDN